MVDCPSFPAYPSRRRLMHAEHRLYINGSIMSGWTFVLLTMSWLLLPWICDRLATRTSPSRAETEIDGLLRVLGASIRPIAASGIN